MAFAACWLEPRPFNLFKLYLLFSPHVRQNFSVLHYFLEFSSGAQWNYGKVNRLKIEKGHEHWWRWNESNNVAERKLCTTQDYKKCHSHELPVARHRIAPSLWLKDFLSMIGEWPSSHMRNETCFQLLISTDVQPRGIKTWEPALAHPITQEPSGEPFFGLFLGKASELQQLPSFPCIVHLFDYRTEKLWYTQIHM